MPNSNAAAGPSVSTSSVLSPAGSTKSTPLLPEVPSAPPQPTTAPESSIVRELVLVSVIAAPLLLLPFLPLRTRLSRISSQVAEIKSLHQTSIRQSSLAQDRDFTALEALRMDLAKHKKDTSTVSAELHALRTAVEETRAGAREKEEWNRKEVGLLRGELQALQQQVQTATAASKERDAYAKLSPRTLNEIASSFVDLAAFVEEMEMTEGLERRGHDPRGVDKLRRLAMNLHAVAETASKESKA